MSVTIRYMGVQSSKNRPTVKFTIKMNVVRNEERGCARKIRHIDLGLKRTILLLKTSECRLK